MFLQLLQAHVFAMNTTGWGLNSLPLVNEDTRVRDTKALCNSRVYLEDNYIYVGI